MKKFLMMVLALCLVFSMVQVTVADDRLKVNGDFVKVYGDFRIRAFNIDNEDYDSDTDDNVKYTDHRLRLGLKITLTEGLTVNFRTDLNDDEIFGNDAAYGRPAAGGPYAAGNAIKNDRAYVRIEKDMFIFQGGQIFQAFGDIGLASAYAPQDHGYAIRLKLPVQIDLNYFKVSEGDDTTDEDDTDKDTDAYAAQAVYKSDMFTIGGYYAMITDSSDTDYDPNVIGIWGNTTIGPVKVRGTLDMFGGSKDSTQDYMGTQLWLNGEISIKKGMNVGANVYYAAAQDEDGSESQLTAMPGKFIGFSPMEKGIQTFAEGFNPTGTGDPFNVSKLGAGAMGADVYGLFGIMNGAVVLGAQFGFIGPSDSGDVAEDPLLGEWSGNTYLECSVKWNFAPKFHLTGAAYTRSASYEESTDSAVGLGAWLQVDF